MNAPDVVIIGGGVIGLSIAYALAAERVSVTVLDACLPGRASLAAAGMLAPLAEARERGPHVCLGVESLGMWPSFVAQLRRESATTLSIYGPGMLRIAQTDAEHAALCSSLSWQQEYGLKMRLLDAAEVHALEPELGPGVIGAIHSPSERCVDPRLLLLALREACLDRGVVIRSNTTVTNFERNGSRILSLQANIGSISGGAYLVAGGAWSRGLGLALDADVPVHPLRGQMLAFGPMESIPLRHVVYAHGGYIVPRGVDRVVAGSTEELAGFNAETTACGLDSINTMATGLIPSLSSASQQSVWAGLRPVSDDGIPILGRIPGLDNAHVATGHGRNGILLTPLTGRLMAAHILHNSQLPAAVNPERFGGSL